ncbi:MAG: hypothetical protein ONB44_24220, partial [candidate division KSB1 bacterium]|nr:hypothetical protein [candidate division KSB1 bacterium]
MDINAYKPLQVQSWRKKQKFSRIDAKTPGIVKKILGVRFFLFWFRGVVFSLPFLLGLITSGFAQQKALVLNEQEYFEMPGLNIMVFHDYYPEGHQGGITIIQNGIRV